MANCLNCGRPALNNSSFCSDHLIGLDTTTKRAPETGGQGGGQQGNQQGGQGGGQQGNF